MRLAGALLLLLVLGCDDSAAYSADMDLICNRAIQESTFASVSPAEKASVLARYIDENLQTDRARELFASLASMTPVRRSETIAAEARANGVAECTILEIWAPPSE